MNQHKSNPLRSPSKPAKETLSAHQNTNVSKTSHDIFSEIEEAVTPAPKNSQAKYDWDACTNDTLKVQAEKRARLAAPLQSCATPNELSGQVKREIVYSHSKSIGKNSQQNNFSYGLDSGAVQAQQFIVTSNSKQSVYERCQQSEKKDSENHEDFLYALADALEDLKTVQAQQGLIQTEKRPLLDLQDTLTKMGPLRAQAQESNDFELVDHLQQEDLLSQGTLLLQDTNKKSIVTYQSPQSARHRIMLASTLRRSKESDLNKDLADVSQLKNAISDSTEKRFVSAPGLRESDNPICKSISQKPDKLHRKISTQTSKKMISRIKTAKNLKQSSMLKQSRNPNVMSVQSMQSQTERDMLGDSLLPGDNIESMERQERNTVLQNLADRNAAALNDIEGASLLTANNGSSSCKMISRFGLNRQLSKRSSDKPEGFKIPHYESAHSRHLARIWKLKNNHSKVFITQDDLQINSDKLQSASRNLAGRKLRSSTVLLKTNEGRIYGQRDSLASAGSGLSAKQSHEQFKTQSTLHQTKQSIGSSSPTRAAESIIPIPIWQKNMQVISRNLKMRQSVSSPFLLALNQKKLNPMESMKEFKKTKRLIIEQGLHAKKQSVSDKLDLQSSKNAVLLAKQSKNPQILRIRQRNQQSQHKRSEAQKQESLRRQDSKETVPFVAEIDRYKIGSAHSSLPTVLSDYAKGSVCDANKRVENKRKLTRKTMTSNDIFEVKGATCFSPSPIKEDEKSPLAAPISHQLGIIESNETENTKYVKLQMDQLDTNPDNESEPIAIASTQKVSYRNLTDFLQPCQENAIVNDEDTKATGVEEDLQAQSQFHKKWNVEHTDKVIEVEEETSILNPTNRVSSIANRNESANVHMGEFPGPVGFLFNTATKFRLSTNTLTVPLSMKLMKHARPPFANMKKRVSMKRNTLSASYSSVDQVPRSKKASIAPLRIEKASPSKQLDPAAQSHFEENPASLGVKFVEQAGTYQIERQSPSNHRLRKKSINVYKGSQNENLTNHADAHNYYEEPQTMLKEGNSRIKTDLKDVHNLPILSHMSANLSASMGNTPTGFQDTRIQSPRKVGTHAKLHQSDSEGSVGPNLQSPSSLNRLHRQTQSLVVIDTLKSEERQATGASKLITIDRDMGIEKSSNSSKPVGLSGEKIILQPTGHRASLNLEFKRYSGSIEASLISQADAVDGPTIFNKNLSFISNPETSGYLDPPITIREDDIHKGRLGIKELLDEAEKELSSNE